MATATKHTRVLLVDDDEDDYLIVRGLLDKISNPVMHLEWSRSFAAGEARINEAVHDVYLVDYRLGAENGIDLLAHTGAIKRSEPFIILTGAGDERIEQLALKQGASDYLVKGTFNTELLARTLRYAVQRKRMEQQRLQHLIDINRAKDEFISLASHQLRTPATAVKQYVGMVLEGYVGDISDAQKNMLETAYQSNERQLQIVSDLLRVAKVDASHVRLNKTEVNVGELVCATLKDLSSKFEQLHQTVAIEQPDTPVLATFDKDNIRMVLENIFDNASKYSGPDKTITVSISSTDTEASIAVHDQGVGIDPADQSKLFIKFSRIDNPLSAEVGGTGLGLYWAKKIMDLHRGAITVTSAEGQGSTFTVSLPK
jgi:two-component system, sensor histidine kinase and response regulator